jgi:hypothetical protein
MWLTCCIYQLVHRPEACATKTKDKEQPGRLFHIRYQVPVQMKKISAYETLIISVLTENRKPETENCSYG